jgi:hypothetical protein
VPPDTSSDPEEFAKREDATKQLGELGDAFLRRHDVRLAFLNHPSQERTSPTPPAREGFRSMLVGIQMLFLGKK